MVLSVVVTVLAVYVSRIQKIKIKQTAYDPTSLSASEGGLRAVCGNGYVSDECQKQYERDMGLRGRANDADDARIKNNPLQVQYERDMGLIGRYEKEYAKADGVQGQDVKIGDITYKGMSRAETDLYIRSLQKSVSGGGAAGTRASGGLTAPGATSSAALSNLDPVEVTVQVTGGSVKFKIALTPKDPNDIIVTIDISCVVGTTAGNCTAAMLSEALTKAGNIRDFFVSLAGAGINVPAMLTALTAQCVNKTTCSYSTSLLAFLITPMPGGPTGNPLGGFNATPTPGTDATVPADRVSIRLRIRPQGVMTERELPYNKLKVAVSVGGGVGTTALAKTTDAVVNEFVSVGDGMFEGTATFDPKILKPGKGYKILVKASKHLTKRFCSPEPNKGKTEPDSTYTCPQVNAGIIELKLGLNNFDFSKVYLPAGDLSINGKQDTVVDSTDFTYIRKKIPSEDPEALRVGDINMDGVIDTQDYVLTISNLVNNVDEL